MSDLRAERERLADAEQALYSPESFPGSRPWMRHRQAEMALKAFDAAHPEILAALKAETSRPEYMDDPSSTYNRALRGED